MVGQKITKVIEVLLRFISKTNALDKTAKQMKKLSGEQKKLEFLSKKFNINANRTKQVLSSQGVQWKKNVGFVDAFGRRMTKFNGVMREGIKQTRGFNMNMLGIMFMGMAVQRVFSSIARAGVTSFTKIMESNNMLGTAVQRLGVHMEFLKFTIGSAINVALERALPTIINFISSLSEWIQKNPVLTSQIILWGFVIGTVLFIVGQLSLGLGSLAGQLGAVSVAGLGTVSVLGFIGAVILGIIVAVKLWGIASGDTERKWHTSTGNMTKDILGFSKDVLVSIAAMFFLIGALIGAIGETIVRGIIGIFQNMVNASKIRINSLKKIINSLIPAFNRLFGADIKPLEVLSKDELNRLKDAPTAIEGIADVWKRFGSATKNLLDEPAKNIETISPDDDNLSLDQDTIDLFNEARSSNKNITINQTNTFETGVDEANTEEFIRQLEEYQDKLAQEAKSYA